MSKTDSGKMKSSRQRRARARLSREAILEAAMTLLDAGSLADFSLTRLAGELGAGVMSLYTYFPSRDSLLDALADEIFARFEAPPPCERWQDEVRGWLWATVRHVDRHPIALRLFMRDGHVAPGWLHIWFPVAALIKRQGVEGADLAFAMNWFSTSAMGFIAAQVTSATSRQDAALSHIGALNGAEQRFALELWFDLKVLDRDPSLAFGFDTIIGGLERIVAERGRKM